MRLSELFTRTLRDAPADADMISHQLAVRAGLVRPVAAGVYALMPLGWRVIRKLEAIIRAEMDAVGGQEMQMPVVHPAEYWEATGRLATYGPVLQTFNNAREGGDVGRDFVLGPTAEEVVTMLALREIDSYRQMPQLVYQIHTKYRNEARPRGGLVRLREFIMKDAYSLDTDFEALGVQYDRIYQAYLNIFARVDVHPIPVAADTGAMGGRDSHEFVLPHEQGEDRFVQCSACGYAANVEVAQFAIPAVDEPAALEPVQKVATPDCTTIQEVADFLRVSTAQTLKAVFFVREQSRQPDEFIFGVIRGDLAINEVKLANSVGGGTLRAATDEEILATGAVPGYASPMRLKPGVTVIADRSVHAGANFVAGANDAGYHMTGVNVPRDFEPTLVADVAEAFDGAVCTQCGEPALGIQRAIELGHCFKLGTRYSEPVGVMYQDANGDEHPVVMGSYGIGLERLLAVIIETHHDDWGIIWPAAVAPFQVHIVTLGKDAQYTELGAQLYADLRAAGYEVLLDDRAESPGVKFADADLIGCPVRLTVSKKATEAGGVEAKLRAQRERENVPLHDVIAWVGRALAPVGLGQ